MPKLKRSNDRKVTNLATPNGKRSAIANTFGLPSGKKYSCPYATSICERICYAGKLEKQWSSVREVLLHNWRAIKNADRYEMWAMLDTMLLEFKEECNKHNAEKLFRIHWDGDFFNADYVWAWKVAIENHPDIQFWAYTRNPDAARALRDVNNLSLYYSADSENWEFAPTGVKLAYLADTFDQAKQAMLALTNKAGASCPEQLKRIPLISEKGGACAVCRLCVDGKSDIRFSISKR